MIHFTLFRHGETDWNREARFQGQLDVPLNDTGRLQAIELGPKLEEFKLQAILSSDLERAVETASPVVRHLKIPEARFFKETALREAHLGLAQGLTLDEIKVRFGESLLMGWKSNSPTDADVAYPGGETGAAVLLRAKEGLENFARTHIELTQVGVCTHGGVIRRLMHWILYGEIKPDEPIAIPNGVIYRVSFDRKLGRWTKL